MKKFLIIFLKIISILFLVCFFVVLSLRLYIDHSTRITTKEEKAVDYIIENFDAFQSDFKAMGYDAQITPAPSGSTLVLFNGNQEYRFDVGFDCFKRTTDNGTELSIRKKRNAKVLKLKHLFPDYYVNVSLHSEEIEKSFGRSLYNDYELDFINYFVRNGDDEYGDDKIIKEHISAEELRKIYKECITLQEKLVVMHKEHKKI